jgi:hypothetical protein
MGRGFHKKKKPKHKTAETCTLADDNNAGKVIFKKKHTKELSID